MQQIVLNRPLNRGFRAQVPHHGYGATIFRGMTTVAGIIMTTVVDIIVTTVAKFFQMIGFCFVAASLKNRVMDCHTRVLLASIPVNERDGTRALALRVIPADIGAFEIRNIFEAVVDIPHEEREEVVTNALLLIKPGMGTHKRTFVITRMRRVPVNERGRVTALVLGAITQDMSLTEMLVILQTVADISSRERADVMEHAFRIFTSEMEYGERIAVIQRMALARADQRANLVQRFREGGDIFEDAPVDVARGINVHQGNRDQRVRAAIELLRKHQGPMSKDRMNQAVREFTQYLNSCEMNPQDKQLAQCALRGHSNRIDFGPLIDGKEFMIKGLIVSGEEVIGRLWIFASNLTGLDQAIAKGGMVSALKESYEMGDRVCQPGKVQRLIVSVLQGRLAKVNIELVEGMKVDKAVAINLFLSKGAHRAIRQLPPLLRAANQFCDDNPLVNRDEFFLEIEAYAQAEFDEEGT